MTAGPWRPVHLEIYDSRVADLWSQIEVSKDLRTASGKLYARIDGPSNKVAFTVKLREKIISQHETAVRADGLAEVSISIENPALWYPHGYGAQAVYEITVDLFTHEFLVDTMSKRTGLRRGELIQEDDKIGQSFYFRINGIDIFCAGSCWIPADNFIPRLDAGKYKKWLQTMIDGNQVMTR
jgi:beta-mannosidase